MRKNYLIITVGTRDVQLRRDLIESSSSHWKVEEVTDVKTGYKSTFVAREGFRIPVTTSPDFPTYYTINPRLVGELLARTDCYSLFYNVLELPLITPMVDHLARQDQRIDTVLLIYTNQQHEYEMGKVKPFHYRNDTLFLADVIERVLHEHPLLANAKFDQYEIFERVADIDYQYTQFAVKNHTLFDETDEVGEIYLLPQGGIDQINQAVTLQLIQAFQHKVKLYQKPDGSNPVKLEFTEQFLDDLDKQKIVKHLEDYDFGLIIGLLKVHPNRKQIDAYAQFGYVKLNLNYTAFPSGIPAEFKEKPITTETRCRDLYLSAKILYKQQDYGNYLFRMYTLLENIYRVKFDQVVGNSDGFFDAKYENPQIENTDWLTLLRRYESLNLVNGQDLFGYLSSRKVGRNSLKINNPNRHLYKHGYDFLISSGALIDSAEYVQLLEKADSILSQLSNFRNKATHNLAPVSIDQLNKAIGKGKLDELNNTLDQIFNITGYGIYDTIRDEIRALL